MTSWSGFVDEIAPSRVHVVYPVGDDGRLKLDGVLERVLSDAKIRTTRGMVVDATEAPDLIILTREVAASDNLRDALEAAGRYSRDRPVVTVAAEGLGEASTPIMPDHDVRVFPPTRGVTYFSVSRRGFDSRRELQNAFETYYAWTVSGRRSPTPIFFPGRPRADENFRHLATHAPISPSSSKSFAVAVAKDIFPDPEGVESVVPLIIDAFVENEPRDLISVILDSDDDFVSDLFLSSQGEVEQWSDEPPEDEEAPSKELVDRFDTSMPPGIEVAHRVNYYEFDKRVDDEVDPITGEKFKVEIRDNCRAVYIGALRATEPLDPETWKARSGGTPIVSAAAIARYEADPEALGTERWEVQDGERFFDRVILVQTDHWSGKFAHAPASSVYPVREGFAKAFANVEIDDATGEVTLLRPIEKGEFLVNDYGEEFFGDTAHPHLALDAIDEIDSKDEEIELLDAMMSHVWDASEAVRLKMDPVFVQHAAQLLLVTDEEVTGLAFGFCADVVPVKTHMKFQAPKIIKDLFEKIDAAKAKIVSGLLEKYDDVEQPGPDEYDAQTLLRRIKEDAIKSDDPGQLWALAKSEWDRMTEYMTSVFHADPVLHAQLQQVTDVLDDEAARVMNPLYNPMIAFREPRLGIEFVLPYTFDALLQGAQSMKGVQVVEMTKLLRDAGIDPDKKIDWTEAKNMADVRDARIAAAPDGIRQELLKAVDFWRGYPEFTVVDPNSHKRELVFSADELLEVYGKELEQKQQRKREIEDEKRRRQESDESFMREGEERRLARAAQDEERERRREGELLEFDRLGRVMLERHEGRGEKFDARDYNVVLGMIGMLETKYARLIKSWNKKQLELWDGWKQRARDAYERAADGTYNPTKSFPGFVLRAIKVMGVFEEHEKVKHPRKLEKVFADLGHEPFEKRGKRKTPKTEKEKQGTGIKKSVSSAKAGSPVKSLSIPSPGGNSYSNDSTFAAADALVSRARGDAVFFFYGTRNEQIVERFRSIFPSATILHKSDLDRSTGVASPEEVTVPVTHFFVLYGGDSEARRWYEHMPRGLFWPYLVATETVQKIVDPEARRAEAASSFKMTAEGRVELFELFQRVEIVDLSD